MQNNTVLAGQLLLASFVVTSILGVLFVLGFWLPKDTAAGIIRATLFVVTMAVVHQIGFRLYRSQESFETITRDVDFSIVRPHLVVITLTQVPCLLLAAMLLDNGRVLRFCVVAVIAHWLAITFIAARQNDEVSKVDSLVMRWGFFPCLATVVLVGNSAW